MKRVFVYIALLLLVSPLLCALDLSVEKKSSNEVLVFGTNQYANFDMQITNNGPSDNLKFYNLAGFDILPSEEIPIGSGETKDVTLSLYPVGDFQIRGGYVLHYFIKGKDSSKMEFELPFIVTDLENAFELGVEEITPESDSINLYIHNKVNFNFDSINVKFSSQFFDYDELFNLGPNQRKDFTIQLSKEDFKSLTAGFYTLEAEISVGEENVVLEAPFRFIGTDILKTETESKGIFVNEKIVRKINNGNTVTSVTVEIKKNILSRLFTHFSIKPDAVERRGLSVSYFWNIEVRPSEIFEVSVVTNWLFPFIVICLIIITTVLVKSYSRTNLILKKKITFVKAKGGEFGLKISIFMHTKKYIENVRVIDRLPPLTKIHEQFGINRPSRIDEKNKRIEWSFEKLEEGETRVLSYFLYSKIGILGRFALPTATAIFERNGNVMESTSNRSFFVSDQKRKDFE